MLGMLTVNFKLVMGATEGGTAWLASVLGLLEGRAAALFVLLAGVGTSLMARREHAAATLRRRAVVLFVFGLAFSVTWPSDILHFYRVYIAVAVTLLRKSSPTLLATALICALAFVLLFMVLDYDAHWNWETLEYNQFWTFDGLVRRIFFNGFHPVVPWIGFFLIGMVLGRTDLSSARWRRRALFAAVTICLASEMISRLYGSGEGVSFLGTDMMPPFPLYVLASSASAVAVLMTALIVVDRFPSAVAVRCIARSGRFSLTIYLAHVVIGMGLLEALGWLEHQHRGQPRSLIAALAFAIAFWLSMIAFATMWSRRHRLGPAEHLLRALCGERTT